MVKINVEVFWVVMPCIVVGNQCSEGLAASIFRVKWPED